MNRPPPDHDPADDVDEQYRRDSALDPSRPSEAVRQAVLEHAERLAAERGRQERTPRGQGGRAPWLWLAARELRWRALVGTLTAAVLAALVIAPEFLTPRATPVTDETPAAAARSAAPQAAAPGESASPKSNARTVSGGSGAAELSEARLAVARAPIAGAPAARAAPPEPPADAAAAFRRAAETGDLAALQALRGGQPGMDSRDSLGRTALLLATLHGERDAVEMLLAWGADPNIADTEGTTPLAAAIDSRRTDLVATLKHYGAR